MSVLKIIFVLLVIFYLPTLSYAQKPVFPGKFKVPVVHTTIDKLGDSSKISVDDGKRIVGMPLTITDNKGKEFKVISYQFLYRRIDQIENPESGNVRQEYSVVGDRFDKTPLPKVWVDNIDRQLEAGEELYYFDVLVGDDKGKIFYAPTLRMIIK